MSIFSLSSLFSLFIHTVEFHVENNKASERKTIRGMRTNVVPALLIVLIAITSESLLAQDLDSSEPLESRIAAMNEQIEAQESALAAIDARATEFESKIKILKADAEKLKGEERALSEELRLISAQRSQAEREIADIEAQGRKVREVSQERLRVLYAHPREELFAFLLNQAGSDRMAQSGYYLSVVRSYDLGLLERLHELKLMRDEKRLELQTLGVSKEKVASEIKNRRAQFQAKIAAQEPLAKSLKSERTAGQQALAELRAKLLRFETVFASLTGAPEDAPSEEMRRERRSERQRNAREETKIPGYDGSGLKGKRTALSTPVSGDIVVGFRKTVPGVDKESRSISKGLEFNVPAGTSITAIADGEVIFVGKIPGVGQVAILDHGERYYSLYGRLSSVTVDRGQEVSQGAQVGLGGEADSSGRSFYFEIRKEGVAVNPQDYFAKRLG